MYKKLSAPLVVQVELTGKCNFNCIHCYNFWRKESEKGIDISGEEAQILINEFVSKGVFHVILTGGEPFLNKEVLYYLVRELSSQGLTVGINSNLATVCKEDTDFLKKMGVSPVLTSLMSSDFRVNDEIAQRSGSFEKTVRGIKLLKEIGVPVAVNMVLSKKNRTHIKETARFVKSLGINNFSVTKAGCPGNCTDFSELAISVEEFRNYLQDLHDIGKEEGMHVDVLESYPLCGIKKVNEFRSFTKRRCLAGVTSMTVGADGVARPCSHLDVTYGNVFEDGLEQVWKRMSPWRDGSMIPNTCKSCDLLKACGGGCRMEAKMINGALNKPDPYAVPKDIPYVISQIESREKKSVDSLPDSFKVNPDVRLRPESFGGVVFAGAKFICYLNKFGFQLLEGLDTKEIYTNTKIKKRFFKDRIEPKAFLEKMFNRGIFVSCK